MLLHALEAEGQASAIMNITAKTFMVRFANEVLCSQNKREASSLSVLLLVFGIRIENAP